MDISFKFLSRFFASSCILSKVVISVFPRFLIAKKEESIKKFDKIVDYLTKVGYTLLVS
nr:MAG TPA_asm: hypothetical protein [Bacteriophage sp.]